MLNIETIFLPPEHPAPDDFKYFADTETITEKQAAHLVDMCSSDSIIIDIYRNYDVEKSAVYKKYDQESAIRSLSTYMKSKSYNRMQNYKIYVRNDEPIPAELQH